MSQQKNNRDAVGPVPPPGVRSPSHGASSPPPNAASGDAAYNKPRAGGVGRVPSHGVPVPAPEEPPPCRLRRLHRVWPDRDGNISYLLTLCVDGRAPVLNNETAFGRLVAFLLDSPARYHWFARRFVAMPDHLHLIAHMGHEAVRLGEWIKALKAVVGGLKRREPADAASGDAAYNAERPTAVGHVSPNGVPMGAEGIVGRVPSHGGVSASSLSAPDHEFTRIKRPWRWQKGFHDHKFRTPESESRKWEYACLNPVRAGLVKRPEEWPFGGEIFYDDAGGPRLVRGTPPLLETGMLMEENDGGTTPRGDGGTPRGGTRPTT